MRALIDSDILPYEFGGMKYLDEETGERTDQVMPFEICRKMMDDRIEQILEAVDATSYSLYLTDSPSNFRNEAATILPYKGNRVSEKPLHWTALRQHLIDTYDAEVQYGIEADDRLGIEQMKDFDRSYHIIGENATDDTVDEDLCETVICSRDKDLHMIPGWHYVWPAGKQEEKLWFQDEVSALRCFYSQLLTGDATDNILGLYGVGAKSKAVANVNDQVDELEMFRIVKAEYENRFGSYWQEFMYENAKLLWILRKDDTQESADRLWELEGQVYWEEETPT